MMSQKDESDVVMLMFASLCDRAASCPCWMTTRFTCGSWWLAPQERWAGSRKTAWSVSRKWAATASQDDLALRAAGILKPVFRSSLFFTSKWLFFTFFILFFFSVPLGWLSSSYWGHVTCSALEQREGACTSWSCPASRWKTARHCSRIRSHKGEAVLWMTSQKEKFNS